MPDGIPETDNAVANQTYTRFDYRSREKTALRVPRWTEKENQRPRLTAELFSILKAIRRRLEKLWLGQHRRCVFSLARNETMFHRVQRGTRCPYANTLLLWRLHLEGFDKLHQLLRQHRARAHYKFDVPIHWYPPHPYLPPPLLHRIFAMECLALLEKCALLVRKYRRKDQHTFSSAFISEIGGKHMPHWLVERRPDYGLRLHVWKHTSTLASWRLINFPGASGPFSKGTKCDHEHARLLERQFDGRRQSRMAQEPSMPVPKALATRRRKSPPLSMQSIT
jgi:hypothetical protein